MSNAEKTSPELELGFDYKDGKHYPTIKFTLPACHPDDSSAWVHRDALGRLMQLAEQHQGEPVALPAEKELVRAWGHDTGGNYEEGKAFGWNACLDEIAKLGPLYTRADPAEVSELRDSVQSLRSRASIFENEYVHYSKLEVLRAQLAEAHALLRDLLDGENSFFPSAIEGDPYGNTDFEDWERRARLALSASAEWSAPSYPRVQMVKAHKHTCANVQPGSTSADICDCGAVVDGEPVQVEPSAPVEIDERADFEKTLSGNYPDANLRRMEDGNYAGRLAYEGWKLWQARAALDRKP